jgi:hypothetical protein
MPRRVALSESAGSPYLMAKNSHFASPVRQHELACIVSSGPTHSANGTYGIWLGRRNLHRSAFEFYTNWARLTVRRPAAPARCTCSPCQDSRLRTASGYRRTRTPPSLCGRACLCESNPLPGDMNLVAKMSIPSRITTLWEVIGARLLNPKWKSRIRRVTVRRRCRRPIASRSQGRRS